MKTKNKVILTSIAAAFAVGAFAVPAMADHGGMGGCGAKGNKAGWHQGMTQRDRDLTADEIRTIYEGKLLQRGADGMKVGEITDAGQTYKFDILNADGTVFRAMEVDKRTGWSTAMMERMKNGGWNGQGKYHHGQGYHHGQKNGGPVVNPQQQNMPMDGAQKGKGQSL